MTKGYRGSTKFELCSCTWFVSSIGNERGNESKFNVKLCNFRRREWTKILLINDFVFLFAKNCKFWEESTQRKRPGLELSPLPILVVTLSIHPLFLYKWLHSVSNSHTNNIILDWLFQSLLKFHCHS